LAAILCWLVSHISSRLLDAPLIAFSEQIGNVRADGVQQRTYTIKNLTRTEVFKNLAFVFDIEGKGSILGNNDHDYSNNDWKKLAPTFVPDEPPKKEGFTAQFPDTTDPPLPCTIDRRHPMRRATLTFFVTQDTIAPLRFKDTEEPILFSKTSFWT